MSKILYPRKHSPYKVFFTWQITYHCNYKCTYCHAKKHGAKGVVDTTILSVKKWADIWNNIYDMYGECEINISGGEPTVYPDFLELIQEITKKHKVEIITNLSYDILKVEKIVKILDPERVKFATSFHPEHALIEEFINKVKTIMDNNFIVITNFVPWIPFLKDVHIYKEKFDKNGIKIVLQPFVGIYNGIEYPMGYSQNEKKLLGIFTETGNSEILEFKTTEHIKKGDNQQDKCDSDENIKEETPSIADFKECNNKINVEEEHKLCRMGENYAFIQPNGDVERCCKDHSVKLGNIIEGTFKLLEDALPCQVSDCYCWRRMIITDETSWTHNWKGAWDQFYCAKLRNVLILAREHKIKFERAFIEMEKIIESICNIDDNIKEIRQVKHDLILVKLEEGWKYIDKGLYDDAKVLSQLLIKKYESSMTSATLMHVYLYTFRIYFLLKQWNEAKKYLIMAKDKNPSYAAIYKLFAMVEFELGNYKETIKMFQTALRLAKLSNDNLEHSEIYYEMAVCLEIYAKKIDKVKFKDIQYKMLWILEQSVSFNPDNQPSIKFKRKIIFDKLEEGWQYFYRGLYDDAKIFSKILIEKYGKYIPSDIWIQVCLYTFRIYSNLGQWNEAKKYLIMAREKNSSYASIYKLLAMAEFELGNYKETKKMFRKALKLVKLSKDNVEYSEIYYEMAVCLEKYITVIEPLEFKNMQDKLLRLLRKSLSLNPNNQLAINKEDIISRNYNQSLIKFNNEIVLDKLKEGFQYIDKQLYDNAKEISKVLIEKYKKDMTQDTLVEVYIYTSHIYFALKQWNEAKKYLNMAKEIKPVYAAIYKLFAMAEFELCNYKETKKMFYKTLRLSKLSKDNVECSKIYYEMAVYCERYITNVGSLKFKDIKYTLLNLLKKSISLNPNNMSAIRLSHDFILDKLKEGFQYIDKQLYDNAKEISKVLIEKYKGNMGTDTLVQVYIYTSHVYLNLKQWNEAKKYLNMAKEIKPVYAAIYKILAMVEFELGNYKETKKMFQTALRYSKLSKDKVDRSEIYYEMVVCLERYIIEKEPLKFENIKYKLLKLLEKSILLNPNNQLAINKKEIVISNKLLIKLTHDIVLSKLKEGFQYINKGLYNDAKEISKVLIEKYKNNMALDTLLQVYLYISRIYFGLGQFDEAKKYLNMAKEIKPVYAAVYKLLAMAEFELKNYKEAKKMFYKAISLAKASKDNFECSEIYYEMVVCLEKYADRVGTLKFKNIKYTLLNLLKKSILLNSNNQSAKNKEDLINSNKL